MEERAVDLGDVVLSVAEAGTGRRPLLLLHGFTGAKEDFTEWLDALAEAGWHAVAPDHRGHGRSSKPEAEDAYSLEILAGDAFRLAHALGWDRFALLGHSMGGMVAQIVALRAPERLDALVLMDTGHGPMDLDPELVDAAAAIVRTQGMEILADILTERPTPFETQAHKRLIDERPGYAAFEGHKLRSTSPALYAALAPAFRRCPDRLADLAAVASSFPVLVIVGEQDEPFLAASEHLATALPSASLVVVPDAGHCPQFENTDAWWEALSGFLARLSPSQ